jgi:isocitrate dehydrogenase
MKKTVTIAKGDGIGPEIMDATLKILKAAEVNLEFEEIKIGEKVYLSGNTSGISPDAWDSLRKNKVFLKAPITTPQGGGYKSLNVTMRKTLGLYANVRPCVSFHPFVDTKHPKMDLVIVRENEEDLYAGIEHQQTDEVVQCLKLISRPGCEKIIRYAFEFTKHAGRKKITCMSKDNIMKQTDGLFHEVFDEVAKEYPEIETEHWIVDIGAARVADTPEAFDVVVMQNLYGDIISDIAAQITGSVGLAGSSNIGNSCAMFEAIHGSAPMIAGQNIANPTGLLQGAVLMLKHVGENVAAVKVQNALLRTIEEGIHTPDIYKEGVSKRKVSTTEFTDAVIANLGKEPETLAKAINTNSKPLVLPELKPRTPKVKKLIGVDLFVDCRNIKPDDLADRLHKITSKGIELDMITNRGVKVWPNGFEETFCTDHWRCRFYNVEKNEMTKEEIVGLLSNGIASNIDVIKTENLYEFDGKKGYSLGQGQ